MTHTNFVTCNVQITEIDAKILYRLMTRSRRSKAAEIRALIREAGARMDREELSRPKKRKGLAAAPAPTPVEPEDILADIDFPS